MTIGATKRLALFLAAGLFVGFAATAPVTAAGTDTATAKPDSVAADPAKPGSHPHKRTSHRKADKVAATPAEAPKTPEFTRAGPADAGAVAAVLPSPVANPYGQLTSAYAPTDTATMPGRAGPMTIAASDKAGDAPPASGPDIVASDELNEVDRALQEQVQKEKERTQALQATQAPPQTVAMVAPAAATAPAASAESTSLDRTSLIGKIFIGVGALLTMASAARMFMA